jgi:hypothetical protein
MRACLGLLTLVFLSTFSTFAQDDKLPEILKPDAATETEARRMGASIVRLLKRGRFVTGPDANEYKDEENPLGIRGGGAFFSFTNSSHSYNKVPQIGLMEDGRLSVGFYGMEYGFFADLGKRDLSAINSETEEVKQYLSYETPSLNDDFAREAKRIRSTSDRKMWAPWVIPIPGSTYLLRAVSTDKPGILVAFQILTIEQDPGSVVIAWKKLADFKPKLLLYTTDKELQEQVDRVLSRLNINGMSVRVEKNQLQIRGTFSEDDLERFKEALQTQNIRHRGIGLFSVRLTNRPNYELQ